MPFLRFSCFFIYYTLLIFTLGAASPLYAFNSQDFNPPPHFGEAKRIAKILHHDHRVTFYCGCTFDKHGKVDLPSCGYSVQNSSRRASRLEWEHIVPVSLWGQALPCWRGEHCTDGEVCYRGRMGCRHNATFVKMESDLHNLVPEIGELNGLRSNYRFGVLPHIEVGQFGTCAIKIDPEIRRVEPPVEVRGIIARAYLYMSETYEIPLSKNQHQLFVAWNAKYPPGEWEIEWDKRIAEIQGNHNTLISEYAKKVEMLQGEYSTCKT